MNNTMQVRAGDVNIGADAPVVVQAMTNTDTEIAARLRDAGADALRTAHVFYDSGSFTAALNDSWTNGHFFAHMPTEGWRIHPSCVRSINPVP